jgi:hypothetical protein
MILNRNQITLRDALRVQSAEFWLKLGQPAEALKELKTLSEQARTHPWTSRVALAALRTCGVLGAHALRSELVVEP